MQQKQSRRVGKRWIVGAMIDTLVQNKLDQPTDARSTSRSSQVAIILCLTLTMFDLGTVDWARALCEDGLVLDRVQRTGDVLHTWQPTVHEAAAGSARGEDGVCCSVGWCYKWATYLLALKAMLHGHCQQEQHLPGLRFQYVHAHTQRAQIAATGIPPQTQQHMLGATRCYTRETSKNTVSATHSICCVDRHMQTNWSSASVKTRTMLWPCEVSMPTTTTTPVINPCGRGCSV